MVLIHGHPRTGSTWHRVAPQLVERGFTVVCPDMRGYGQSGKAEIRSNHGQQSKRVVALDMVRLMDALGHPTCAAVGHDRGCHVALRMALDHPDVVSQLVVMDGDPSPLPGGEGARLTVQEPLQPQHAGLGADPLLDLVLGRLRRANARRRLSEAVRCG